MQIKLLQWNIWYKENPEKIAKVITQINPDIACLQELTTTSLINKDVDIPQKISSAMSNANYYYEQAQNWDNKSDNREQGNGIFSKFPIITKKCEYLQKPTVNPTNFSQEGRIYIEITVNIQGKILTIGTTHLSYTHRFVSTQTKEKEVNKLIELIKNKKENYILTGDFNTPPESTIIKNIQKYITNCGPDFSENTWTTKPFAEGDFSESKLDWRLDYIFKTNDIKSVDAKIIQTDVSDHLPLLLSINI